MKFPLLVSVPHAGERVPPEVKDICILSREDILADGDEGAREIYSVLKDLCETFITTDIARALIDLNRAPDDIGGDGVIKSHTSWNVPVYSSFPDKALVQTLLNRYYLPYHKKLSTNGAKQRIKLGIDCHTMSVVGPPVAPDPGRERPFVCLSNAEGTCPAAWIKCLADSFAQVFRDKVTINNPFKGGYITRQHAAEMYWLQIEISRTQNYSATFKRNGLVQALQLFCRTVF
jgi:N-formylglutamate deformylase